MPLILRCVPLIHDFDCCICTLSLKKSTMIIGWFTLVISSCKAMMKYAMILSHFQGNEFETSIKESKEFFIFKLVVHVTIATVSFLLLLGVHFEVPVLMLPSLLVQLLIDTSLAVMHTMFFLFSGRSDMRFGMIAVTVCTAYIGFVTFLWMVQYNCYRQFVDKRHCTCGEAIKVKSQYPENLKYHTEDIQNDYTALNAVFIMSGLNVIANQPNHTLG